MPDFTLHHGNCLDILKTLPPDSIDSVVTDPPYGLKFMGRKWDYDVPSVEVWAECLRVLKPGGHLLAFAGTRTQHRMAVRIEDAGFEIRDMIAWVYGSGFPKSLDVSKAIDKAAGADREIGPVDPVRAARLVNQRGEYETEAGWSAGSRKITIDPPATDAARQWSGWGTALKPAMEPITVARKPLIGTVAENALQYETGALNIDACRVPVDPVADATQLRTMNRSKRESDQNEQSWGMSTVSGDTPQVIRPEGRWPSNLIHDGSEEVLEAFPQAPGQLAKAAEGGDRRKDQNVYGAMTRGSNGSEPREDGGSAARFFYCAKASKSDRNSGLDSTELVTISAEWENEDLEAQLLVDTAQLPPRVIGVYGAQIKDVSVWNTFLFGSDTTGRSLAGCRFTIATVTNSTTESKTLRYLAHLNTSASTVDANCEKASGGSHAENAGHGTTSATITGEATVCPLGASRAPSRMRFTISAEDARSTHPTVKPANLMRYLCRLVTPVGGVVLDPFMGSGSTGKAAMIEGFRFVGIELDQAFIEIARRRISSATAETP